MASEKPGKLMSRALIITGILFASIFAAIIIAFFVMTSMGPDTSVYTGRQIPKRFMTTIRSLNLLKDNEQIKYFYSDALTDIKEGFYFVTDKNLIIYSDKWEEPETVIPLDQIVSLDVQYDDSFLDDTYAFITTLSGLEMSFPISSEKGLDKKFVKVIQDNMQVKPVTSQDQVNILQSDM